jgi:ribosomal protein S12 methylthiotransferase
VRIAVVSLGCNKNLVDTEVMLGFLHKAGCVVVEEPADADCLLINTCSFLTEAVEESIDRIVELAQLKKDGGPERLVVTGCLVSRYGDEILKEVPEVDALVGHKDLEGVVKAVKGEKDLNLKLQTSNLKHLFPFRVRSHPEHRAYIKIGEGCSNWCAYCLIPSIRGEFASRPAASLVSEMDHLVGQGVREITLVAQDSGRYGQDLGKDSLPSLVRALLAVPGDYWLRVLYVHPARVSDELLETLASDPRVCRYLDVPFQHASTPILEKMGRGDAPAPMDVVNRIRSAIPDAFLRTTLMTGFPGETEDDFNELIHFIQEAGIDHLGVFPYSLEEGTPAAGMKDQVPLDVARSRADRLMEAQAVISAQRLTRLVGQELTVLAEGFDEKGPFGRHQGQAPEVDGVVRLDEDVEAGAFVRVRITDSDVYDLKGEVMEQETESIRLR